MISPLEQTSRALIAGLLHVRACVWDHFEGVGSRVPWQLPEFCLFQDFLEVLEKQALCHVMILPLGTTPKVTHQLFGCQVWTKERSRTGNPKVTFLLALVRGVCNSLTAVRTFQFWGWNWSAAEVGTGGQQLLGQCDAGARGESAEPRSSRHGTKGAGKAGKLRTLALQSSCFAYKDSLAVLVTWLCLLGVVWVNLVRWAQTGPTRSCCECPNPHGTAGQWQWHGLPTCAHLHIVHSPAGVLLLSLVTMFSTGWVLLLGVFLMFFNLILITVTHSALVENLSSLLYKICSWHVSGQHINSCWFPPVLLIFLELKYFINNGYYCYDFGVGDFPICWSYY